ncbi:MAG: Do family serine endopeptidase [Muribaculaceae bacterium]|nr:Do family serine endopeptidase [Muribaculaceae bacterium]
MRKVTYMITAAMSGLAIIACANTTAPEEVSASRGISRDDFVQAAESTVNGVVSVKSFATPQAQPQRGYSDPFFEYFFGAPRQPQQPREQPRQRQLGLGSGVIISDDGYIVTNNHVIEHAERLEVTLNDNRNYTATVVGADPVTDLALIKIEAPGDLHVIPMGDSEALHVGEWVLAVGNPFGFTSTVTSGIVSAKARNISITTGTRGNGIESYIQTDAALNSGNSGGALVNLDGELVGINTAIYSQTGTYAGCSFAIPTSIVSKVVSDLKEYGTVQRAFLGISFVELTPELIEAEKLASEPAAGIYVADVQDRSAAMEAGLAKGDIITAIDERPTRTTAQMQEAVTHFSPGESASITYWRDGKKMQTRAVFRNSRGGVEVTRPQGDNPLAAKFESIDADTARRLEIRGGVAVSEISSDSPLAAAGVRDGFVILAVNGQRISDADEFMSIYRAILASGAIHDKVLFLSGIYPDGKVSHYAVPLSE